jgi:hypothetical protein
MAQNQQVLSISTRGGHHPRSTPSRICRKGFERPDAGLLLAETAVLRETGVKLRRALRGLQAAHERRPRGGPYAIEGRIDQEDEGFPYELSQEFGAKRSRAARWRSRRPPQRGAIQAARLPKPLVLIKTRPSAPARCDRSTRRSSKLQYVLVKSIKRGSGS